MKPLAAIFALNLPTRKAEWDALNLAEIPFTMVEGVYNGEHERSYLVNAWVPEDYDVIMSLAAVHSQENVLVVMDDMSAKLVYTDGSNREEQLGKFTYVTEKAAKDRTCYSYIPNTGQYWVTV